MTAPAPSPTYSHPDVTLRRARRIQPLDAMIDLRFFVGLPDPPYDVLRVRVGDKVSGLVHVADLFARLCAPRGVFSSMTRCEVASQIPDELADDVVAFSVDPSFDIGYGPDGGTLVNLYAADPAAGVIDAPQPQRIPELPERRMRELAQRIRAVGVRDGELWEMRQPDPAWTAFSWDPQWSQPARDLVEVARVRTFHTFGAPSFFKPSKAEVIAQIPAALVDVTVAFATDDPELADGGRFHAAHTVLYAAA